MTIVSIRDAEANLLTLVQRIESGEETEIVIARDGRPAARLVAVPPQATSQAPRFGLFAGQFATYSQEEFDSVNDELRVLFGAGA